MMKIIYNLHEDGVRSTTLRATRAIPHGVAEPFFDSLPKSHKKYTFTFKENRTSMLKFLEATPNYYHILMRRQFLENPSLKNAIWFEETDSRGIKHIHGVITSPKHIYFKKLQMPGLQFYGKKMSQKIQPLQTADEILLGRRAVPEQVITSAVKWKNPTHWEKYILKGKKTKLFIILREKKKIKIMANNIPKENAIPKKI